ncbi:uncharacterized protein LOC128530458 [Clarias gariepinus]|uniref:uncharacterized protein LOC128530458 n=1 Tax=Clarias gariepinus TaxID=13013 RepID=UPI00234E1433|nr:uncharacterized protein LOC128530458 [Clarias gariepinus]XP_053360395.1 uncharacterized protein LOC128530458 [Clarias gariepinus]XP_053360396.1 uncharacterized protein LOC128530458 [Clarias gariepinus]XP_053360397.1 uncharacterized protein LOC128530458 [Clarias gariepinus]
MGDDFASRGLFYPAQICYMVAQIELGSRPKFQLIGHDSTIRPGSKSSLKVVTERTEVYEYALSLISGFGQSDFQQFKAFYAWKLFGNELDDQALDYCESVATTILRFPHLIKSNVLKCVTYLSDNLIVVRKEKEPEWLRKLHQLVERRPKSFDVSSFDLERASSSVFGSHDVALHEFHPSQHNEFDTRYAVVELIVNECFGALYTGLRKADGKEVTIKCMAKPPEDELITIPGQNYMLPREVVVMELVSKHALCENVVELLEWFETSTFYILVVERPNSCITLHKYCKLYNSRLPEPVAQKVMQQVVRAVHHCCECGVLHCNFEQNLLINPETLEVKLVDFGSAELMMPELYTDFAGSLAFAPPEWVQYSMYFGLCAIFWGLGVLLFELVCGDSPFGSEEEIVKGNLSFAPGLSDECCDLIQQCLNKDPDCRLTFKQILEHKWFEEGLEDSAMLLMEGSDDHPHRTGESDDLQRYKILPAISISSGDSERANSSVSESQDVDIQEFHPSQHNEFDTRYAVVELIVSECFGALYTGVCKADGKEVTIKCMIKPPEDELFTIPGQTHMLPQEVGVMKLVSQPPLCENVVELLEWFEAPTFHILVVEQPKPCLNLHKFCKLYNSRLPEPVAQKVMQQVVRAVRHCCERGVLHCDFEQNILINPETLEVKLMDFGSAELMTPELYTDLEGSLALAPPQWVQYSMNFGLPAVFWGLGVLLFELISGELHFCSEEDTVRQSLSFARGQSDEHCDLIQHCLNKDAECQPTFKEILEDKRFEEGFQDSAVMQTEGSDDHSCSTGEADVLQWDEKFPDISISPDDLEWAESQDVDLQEFHPSQQNEFDTHYIVEELIANKRCGALYTGVRKADGKEVAIKCMARPPEDEHITIPGRTCMLPREVVLMKLVSKPPLCENVVELLEWFEAPTFYILVVERPNPCINLHKFCKLYKGRLPEAVAQKVMQQVVQAVHHCCERGVLHCDFEENILINPETLEVKLVDFGSAELMMPERYIDLPGSLAFSPPEWVKYRINFGLPAIFWGLGVLLFELVCGELPFGSEEEIIKRQLSFVSGLSDECCDLIQHCLNKDPECRPTFKEILDHKWFEEGLQDLAMLVTDGSDDHSCRTGEPGFLQRDKMFPAFSISSGDSDRASSSVSESQDVDLQEFHPSQHNDFDARYAVVKVIVSECFGALYTGVRKADGKEVTIKCMLKPPEDELITIPGQTYFLPLEVVLMELVSKPPLCENVVELLEWFETSTFFIWVVERPNPSINLDKFCKLYNGRLPEPVAQRVMWQVIRAVHHCCERGVFHCDFEQNLLINPETLEVKLVDFGSAELMTPELYTDLEGSPAFSPSEWVEHSMYFGLPALFWGLGVLLFELVCGKLPFCNEEEIVKGNLPSVALLSDECCDLIQQCLNKNPNWRPTFKQILNHKWFEEDELHDSAVLGTEGSDDYSFRTGESNVQQWDEIFPGISFSSEDSEPASASVSESQDVDLQEFHPLQDKKFVSRYAVVELLGDGHFDSVYTRDRNAEGKEVDIKCKAKSPADELNTISRNMCSPV